MNIETILHISDFTTEREMIEVEIQKNIHGKLDSYLQKYNEQKIRIEVTITRDKPKNESAHSTFTGKIQLSAGNALHLSDREKFENLTDLINHLFTHIKEQMAR